MPVQFYEITFLCTFAFIPFAVFRGDLESYVFGIVVVYMCLRVIRGRKKTKLKSDGKAVFVSGCDSGFGYFISESLDSEGYTVFAGCLDPAGEGADHLKAKCSDRLHIVPIDVTEDFSVKVAGEYVKENLGDSELWAVINNAGIYVHGDVELCPVSAYRHVADVNFFGMVRVTQEFLPFIRKSQGRIINMSSVHGKFTWPCSSAYNATQYAIECTSDSLRMEMIKFGVKVAIIEPGMYGGNTNLHSDHNANRHFRQIEKFWDHTDSEVKNAYTKQYMKDQIDILLETREKMAAKSPDGVINAVLDAVTSSHPKYRYLVHGGPFPIDPSAALATVYPYLPEYVTDWFICRVSGHAKKDILKGSHAIQKQRKVAHNAEVHSGVKSE